MRPYVQALLVLACALAQEALHAQDPGDLKRKSKERPARPELGIELGPAARLPSAWWREHGCPFHVGEPDKPAVLLFHGLHRDQRTWTQPGSDEGILRYRFRQSPEAEDLGVFRYPGVGIYKIGPPRQQEEIDHLNWFDYLASQGCTVATFSQAQPTVEEAMRTARDVWLHFVEETTRLFPESPPPIALLGHSRGGLVIRRLIQELRGEPALQMDRVRWVFTLHSPHRGSEVARAPEIIEEEIRRAVGGWDPVPDQIPIDVSLPQIHQDLIDVLIASLRQMVKVEDRELAPDSAMIAAIAQGETPLANAQYYTFGGTNPNYLRICTWRFTAASALPQASMRRGIYYKWEVVPHEIGSLSPMFAEVRDLMDEIAPGKGDGLVSDVRSRLPWSIHETQDLNHAEVLWDRTTQRKVAARLLGSSWLERIDEWMVAESGSGSPGRGERQVLATKGSDPQQATQIVANPELRGRLGRIVIAFPEETPCTSTRIEFLNPGDQAAFAAGYGSQTAEVLPGRRLVRVNGKQLEVEVESRCDTLVAVGAVRVSAGSGTRVELLDSDRETVLAAGYGELQWGLPIGSYLVRVSGMIDSIEIAKDSVTDF